MNGHATQPAKVPTDTVIPLHTLDDASFYKRMVTSITFQFNDVLDPDRLRLALERLLSMEGWTKLGGRLRKNVSVCVAFQAQEQAMRGVRQYAPLTRHRLKGATSITSPKSSAPIDLPWPTAAPRSKPASTMTPRAPNSQPNNWILS